MPGFPRRNEGVIATYVKAMCVACVTVVEGGESENEQRIRLG